MKHIILILLIVLIATLLFQSSEGFTPYGPYQIGNNQYQNAHGNAPPGVHAMNGKDELRDNAYAASVDPVQPGNPQNVWPEYKKQP